MILKDITQRYILFNPKLSPLVHAAVGPVVLADGDGVHIFLSSSVLRPKFATTMTHEVSMFRRFIAGFTVGCLALPFCLGAQAGGAGAPSSMVASKTGLVVSVRDIASDVGAAILRKGGNAVDAAVATAFALSVVHPGAGNIGGGGYMIIRPVSGEPIAIDYRERAPLASDTNDVPRLGRDGSFARPQPQGTWHQGFPAPCVDLNSPTQGWASCRGKTW